MTTMTHTEPSLIEAWLDARLKAYEPLQEVVRGRIFQGLAPAEEEFPFITYQWQSGQDVRGVGPVRMFSDTLYLVKAICGGETANEASRAARLADDAITETVGEDFAGGHVLVCIRQEPFSLDETDGQAFHHRGGLYQIQAQV